MQREPLVVSLTRRLPERTEAALVARFDVRFPPDDTGLDGASMRRALEDSDVVVCTVADQLPAAVIPPTPRAGLLANYGVGVNHIDLAAATAAGLAVTNTPGVLTEATAELAIGLILMLARRLGEGERQVRAGRWTGWSPTQLLGSTLEGRVLGIVGMGRIGRATARRAALGLGMRILYHSRTPIAPGALGEVAAERAASLEDLLERADVVSLHCPLTADTRHLISAERLAMMRPTAFLVNTARGEIVDEAALVEAVRSGRMAGCGLDVFEHEPEVHPGLLALEQVVLLPHLGSATVEAREAMGELVLENIEAWVAGRRPPNLVS